ncbi:Rgg/GadR/MutR family transcriptional regulator [Listeria ivanovii]|uniref:Helix-turn-helix domain-containing protein n=1 Tax=Listeria ivanovii subsp. londoniensis TaxID=202752 RepID=A0ABS1G8K8_LISIV|nr:Rgg/GadR/MutR family transcriptional regulator [Listeria ivanovii]MBK1962921.1 helix-turn-helix domain-containing protein [Listeria ivanovii subsp. londoniensis]MBM5721723.1 Rgg/GadR/MutR family transcriptional regulator [Listeria ivanovii]
MKTVGETIKEIRTSKNLTMESLCSETLSLSTIKRIENDTINTSFINLENILLKLNISFDEFTYIRNNYNLSTKKQLIFEFRELTSVSVDIEQIKKLISKYKTYLDDNSDNEINNYLKFLKALLVINQTTKLGEATPLVESIWVSLENLDNWYWNDIQILSNIFFIFPMNEAESIVELLLERIKKYDTFNNSDRLYIALMLNYIQVLLLNNNFKKAYQLVDKAILYAKDKKLYLHWANAIAKKGIIEKKLGYPNADTYITEAKQILNVIQEPKYIEDLNRDIKHFCMNIPK